MARLPIFHVGGDIVIGNTPVARPDAEWLLAVLMEEWTSAQRVAARFTGRPDLANQIMALSEALRRQRAWGMASAPARGLV